MPNNQPEPLAAILAEMRAARNAAKIARMMNAEEKEKRNA